MWVPIPRRLTDWFLGRERYRRHQQARERDPGRRREWRQHLRRQRTHGVIADDLGLTTAEVERWPLWKINVAVADYNDRHST